jgi:hypothetical protein
LLGAGANVTGPAPTPLNRYMANLSSGRSVLPVGPGIAPMLVEAECQAATSWGGNRGGGWIQGDQLNSTFNTYFPPNGSIPDCHAHGRGWFAARSVFAGGVHVLLGDGSVRFVMNGVDINTWRALSTRGSGEAIELP